MTCPARSDEARRFLQCCLESGDWTGLLIKGGDTGDVAQRVGSVAWACSEGVQEWLRDRNAARHAVFAGVNALASGARSRSSANVVAVRHVFLDVDRDARTVLASLEGRSSFPEPSYVVHTSLNRVHVLWRVRGFDAAVVERVQKRLARDIGGDPAATSVAQMTRLPGFWNYKYPEPFQVWVEYRDAKHIYTPREFLCLDDTERARPESVAAKELFESYCSPAERARAYLSRVPPAVAGQHGDLHTFQTCCRLVRGFALADDQALAVLSEWNARCQPPWTERELREKLRSARRNGREPIGGML